MGKEELERREGTERVHRAQKVEDILHYSKDFTMTRGTWYILMIYAKKLLLIFHTNLSKRGKTPGTRVSVDVHITVAFLKGNACLIELHIFIH